MDQKKFEKEMDKKKKEMRDFFHKKSMEMHSLIREQHRDGKGNEVKEYLEKNKTIFHNEPKRPKITKMGELLSCCKE